MLMYKFFNEQIYKIPKSKIILIENFLNKEFLDKIRNEVLLLEKKSKNVKKFYLKDKSKKDEYLDYNEYYKNQTKLIKYLSSKKFKDYLKKKLNINEAIFPDKSNGYSGFNIVRKNGFLKPHIDFNFNSKIKKFRTINLLIYFNKNWLKKYGGNLIFYKLPKMEKKFEFLAKENVAVFFLTNGFTPHGYKKINTNKKRISLNFYYYTKTNFSFSKTPHKTLWK